MRLIVINTVGDSSTEQLRRRNPGKVLQRPTIIDAPLAFPAGRRVLPRDLLTAAVVDRLEYLVSIGNIRVLEMGARQSPVVFDEIRQRLGLTARTAEPLPPAPSADAAPAVPAAPSEGPAVSEVPATVELTEGTTVEGVAVIEGGEVKDVIVDDSVETMLSELGAEPPVAEEPTTATPEAWVAPDDLATVLGASKAKPMQAALAVFGKSGAGKAKLVLIEELTALFAGDADPADKHKALALVRGQEA